MSQLLLPFERSLAVDALPVGYDRLVYLLAQNLDFHDQPSRYASHAFHAFPAKFPPQLPAAFVTTLTQPGDMVLDPMMGSGTTLLEALLAGRQGVGFDIDPLALRIVQAKVTPLDPDTVLNVGRSLLRRARQRVKEDTGQLIAHCTQPWDDETRAFANYWFAAETQRELLALCNEIALVDDERVKNFLEVVVSSVVITKSGGVSLAFDLAHTRPHRAKRAVTKAGQVIIEGAEGTHSAARLKLLTKTLRSPCDEFEKRLEQNVKGLRELMSSLPAQALAPTISLGNAQQLALPSDSVDLIVTSPPYASNAIDYMRAHKFALIWFGHAVADLSRLRRRYIGGDALVDNQMEPLPAYAAHVVTDIASRDAKKGAALLRYYSEMTRTLREMFRVLRPAKAAIVVVGSSVMRGRDTETAECLADIGRALGFRVPPIGIRHLDRDRRMLPAGNDRNHDSQIQQRMHEEYVIGFYKPDRMERRKGNDPTI
jgi:DNA modification methylase